MKKIALIAALGLMGMGSAMAQTVGGSFDVTVNLLSRCTLTPPAITTLDFGDYTAFGGAVNSNTAVYTLLCTRGLGAPTITFDNLGADGTTAGAGVVRGLRYTITSTVATVAAGDAATATPSSIGTPFNRTVSLQGSMIAGQVGDVTLSPSQTRQLMIAY